MCRTSWRRPAPEAICHRRRRRDSHTVTSCLPCNHKEENVMATNPTFDATTVQAAVGEAVRRHRGLFLFEGILLTSLGVIAVLVPVVASFAATIFFGWIFLLSG